MDEKRILGRGLSSIFNDLQKQNKVDEDIVATEILIKLITRNPKQPRKIFNKEKMDELIDSIKSEGVLQPILVRKIFDTESEHKYQIIAGERRWRASVDLNLEKIPAIVLECNDQTALQLGLIENLQRDNLSAIEEATSIKSLIDEFGKTQEEISKMISKSRSHVANMLRLLKLPESVQEMVQSGELTAGHARAILESENPEELAKKIINDKLNVRETESIVRSKKQKKTDIEKDQDIYMLEKTLQEYFGTKVSFIPKQDGGVIQIHFYDYNSLDKFLEKITGIV